MRAFRLKILPGHRALMPCIKFLFLLGLCRLSAQRAVQVGRTMMPFPKAMDLGPMLEHLEVPEGELQVLYPVAGMLSSKPFEKALGLKIRNLGTYDVESKYRKVLSPMVPEAALHLGDAGDITKIDLEDLPIPHYLIGGPPCPPWAGNGNKASTEDVRSNVYEACLRWIKRFRRICGVRVGECERYRSGMSGNRTRR